MALFSLPRFPRRETPPDLDALMAALARETTGPSGTWAVTTELIGSIVALGAPGIDALTGAVWSSEPGLRSAVAEHLQALKDPRTLGPLVVALRAEHGEVRAAAATAIAHLPDPRAGDALARALADPSPDVRRVAALALGERADARAVPQLVALAERDPDAMAWEMVRWLALAAHPLPGVPPRLDPPPTAAAVAAVLRPVVDAVPGLDDQVRTAADRSLFDLDGVEVLKMIWSAPRTGTDAATPTD